MLKLAQVRQELQKARKEYFTMKLQKEDELATALEQTAQDMRYLDKRLRELVNNLMTILFQGYAVHTRAY